MTTGSFALKSAIYTALNNDSTLTDTHGAGVYDDVPEGSGFPYVTMGEETAIDYGVKGTDGSEQTVNIHVWSQYRGSKEVKTIMDRIHTLLHDSSLSVSGFNLVNTRFEFMDILRDPDGITRHGVMRFRAVMLGTA